MGNKPDAVSPKESFSGSFENTKDDRGNVLLWALVQISVLEHAGNVLASVYVRPSDAVETHARAHAKCSQLPGMRETADTRNDH